MDSIGVCLLRQPGGKNALELSSCAIHIVDALIGWGLWIYMTVECISVRVYCMLPHNRRNGCTDEA